MTASHSTSTDIVLGLSFETWDDMVRRDFARPPDRLAQFLLARDDVDRLLVINPWRSVAGQLRRRCGRLRDAPFPDKARSALVRPLRARRSDPPALPALTRSYRTYGRVVRVAARRHGLSRPALITFNPFYAAFGDHTEFSSVTYVARDDWASYHGTPHLRAAYLHSYERIRARGIRVSAVSGELLGRLAPTGQARVVPNGVDPGVWTQRRPVPPTLADLPRPIAIYTGTVDERLSLPALQSLARALTGGTLLLVGPHDAETLARIRGVAPDVRVMSSMKQSELAAYVLAADVCVVPHVVSDLTRAMSPLKVYEYLAAGLPVVATDLPPIRDVEAKVDLVADLDDFGAVTLQALARGRTAESERLQFIADNAWASRCEAILDLARDGVAR